MKQTLLAALAMATSLSACATGPDAATRAGIGAAAGAAIGALAGSAAGDTLGGAGIGAVAGGGIGAMVPGSVFEGRQYYRDTRGYCYFVDRQGQPHYDGTVRC